jgi:hypothetical protein
MMFSGIEHSSSQNNIPLPFFMSQSVKTYLAAAVLGGLNGTRASEPRSDGVVTVVIAQGRKMILPLSSRPNSISPMGFCYKRVYPIAIFAYINGFPSSVSKNLVARSCVVGIASTIMPS